MGKRFGIPLYTWFRREALSGDGDAGFWDLIWLYGAPSDTQPADIPADKHFRKAEVATMRDSWDDANGFAVAMQGGNNGASHRHLDLGSFILESDGVRWIVDSGKEGQTYHTHRNKTARSDFYRVRAEGHNTLVIAPQAGPDQDPRAQAAFTGFVSSEKEAAASLDLSAAYAESASSVTRSFRLERGKSFTVSDRIVCHKPSEIWSFFHTHATVVRIPAGGRTAILSQGGKKLTATLTQPAGAVFKMMPAAPLPRSPDPEANTPNTGFLKLAVHLTGVSETEISVRFAR